MKRPKPTKVRLALGRRSYDIHVGGGALEATIRALARRKPKRGFLIADEALTRAREHCLTSLRAAGWEMTEIAVKAGEKLKELDSIDPLYSDLISAGARRDSVIFALGGGTVGDAAGFVAATYLRGVDWVGIPTTLLAQVDSSIGGKTGVNHRAGKNLVGAFHQPIAVACESAFLETLSAREITSGLGEVVKCALTFDPKLLAHLAKTWPQAVALEPKALVPAVRAAIAWKCRAVAADELDRKGVREVLNFGHTFGHALESATGYGHYQHGEAVLWGIRYAIALSQVRKHLSPRAAAPIRAFLDEIPLPPLPSLPAAALFDKMKNDKKVRAGKLHFVLLKRVGKTVSDPNVTAADLERAFELMNRPPVVPAVRRPR